MQLFLKIVTLPTRQELAQFKLLFDLIAPSGAAQRTSFTQNLVREENGSRMLARHNTYHTPPTEPDGMLLQHSIQTQDAHK